MSIKLEYSLPSEEIGFVEYGRSFCVQGKIIGDESIPNDASLIINLIDSNNKIVRNIHSNIKNQEIDVNYKDLTCYPLEMDKDRSKLKAFGFPELLKDEKGSLRNGSIKLWYSDSEFKGIIISCSNVESGALLSDGMDFYDEFNKPYKILEKGNYKLETILSFDDKEFKAYKDVIIGERSDQFICRFNPSSHKERMLKFCKENNISIIKDLMPGYLDPYLGIWLYHMGLLKMYRANDICLYRSAKVLMFIYLIDKTSTSYETELAYLLSNNKLLDEDRFTFYYYDIGEAIIGNRNANVLTFKKDEYMKLCRIDILNNKQDDNIYYLDNRNVKKSLFALKDVTIKAGEYIALMGVLKPYQLDPSDFILKDDNTYEIKNYPDSLRYEIKIDDKNFVIDKKVNMERVIDKSIGNSVYEFYNVFKIDESLKNKNLSVNINCLDKYGKLMKYQEHINIKVV